MLSGHCRVDAGAFPWPISPPLSLQCRLCEDGDSYTSIDDFYDHVVAVHLPKPSHVSSPIVTAHHACGTRGAQWDTSFEGRDHGRGGEETKTDTSGSRGRRTRGAFCKNTTQLMGIIIKQCLRTEQDTRSLCGALFDTIIMAKEHDVVKSMREQTRLYKENVQTAGKGHTLGPPQIWAWGGLIAGLQKQGAAVGAANAVTLTGYLRQLDGMSMDAKCDHARFCRVDRTYQSEQARITLSVDRSGVRDSVVSALQQLGRHASTAELLRHNWHANCSSGWTPYSTSREGRNSVESCRCVAGRAGKRECVISFSTCGTCLFVEAELAGRRDARFGILPDLFDG